MEIDHSEKELQQKIADGVSTPDTADAKAYRAVFNALKKDPGFQLPESFAVRVAALALQASGVKETGREKWWFASGIIAFLGACIFAITQIDFSKFKFAPGVGVFTFVSNNAGLLIFGLVFIIGLHLAEKKLLGSSKK